MPRPVLPPPRRLEDADDRRGRPARPERSWGAVDVDLMEDPAARGAAGSEVDRPGAAMGPVVADRGVLDRDGRGVGRLADRTGAVDGDRPRTALAGFEARVAA